MTFLLSLFKIAFNKLCVFVLIFSPFPTLPWWMRFLLWLVKANLRVCECVSSQYLHCLPPKEPASLQLHICIFNKTIHSFKHVGICLCLRYSTSLQEQTLLTSLSFMKFFPPWVYGIPLSIGYILYIFGHLFHLLFPLMLIVYTVLPLFLFPGLSSFLPIQIASIFYSSPNMYHQLMSLP